MIVAGVDGCRAGWLAVRLDLDAGEARPVVLDAFDAVAAFVRGAAAVLVDMPIGLPDAAEPGGRACDRAARRWLGPDRGRSVFSPPVRAALAAPTYREALARQRASSAAGVGLSLQAYGIARRILELDLWITPARQRRVREGHPEIAFARLNGGRALDAPKRARGGRAARAALLARAGIPPLPSAPPRGASADDLLDAAVLALAARDLLRGAAIRLPPRPSRDARGLAMEILG